MKQKFTIAGLLLNFICLGLRARHPLVFNDENAGAGYLPVPSLPSGNSLLQIL